MTNITEERTFDAFVKRYDELDPVLGGIAGESNEPIIALTNRSRFLYDYHNSFVGVEQVTASATIDNTFLRKLIYINITGSITLTLGAIAGFIPGHTLHFKCRGTAGKRAAIVANGSQTITDGIGAKNIWLYDGEEIDLVVMDATTWEIRQAKGNQDIAGNDAMVRKQPRNSLVANGTAGYSRNDYARLWAEVSALAVDDATWLSDPLNYRCYFSTGNGTTTFRVPDMRGISWKGLDAGRGLSFARNGTTAGAYEPDGNKSHNHNNGSFNRLMIANGLNTTTTLGDASPDANEPSIVSSAIIAASGNGEASVKTAGFIPVIYF